MQKNPSKESWSSSAGFISHLVLHRGLVFITLLCCLYVEELIVLSVLLCASSSRRLSSEHESTGKCIKARRWLSGVICLAQVGSEKQKRGGDSRWDEVDRDETIVLDKYRPVRVKSTEQDVWDSVWFRALSVSVRWGGGETHVPAGHETKGEPDCPSVWTKSFRRNLAVWVLSFNLF